MKVSNFEFPILNAYNLVSTSGLGTQVDTQPFWYDKTELPKTGSNRDISNLSK